MVSGAINLTVRPKFRLALHCQRSYGIVFNGTLILAVVRRAGRGGGDASAGSLDGEFDRHLQHIHNLSGHVVHLLVTSGY